MKKLMIAVAGAMALACSAFADNEWFNGGIEDGWPNAASMTGGAWDNTASGTYAEGAVTVSADVDAPLSFTGAVEKATADYAVKVNSTLTFTAFEAGSLPEVPASAKAGVISCGGYFYVLAKDPDGTTNVWTATDIEATETADVAVQFNSTNEVEYSIAPNGGATSTRQMTVAAATWVKNVHLSGDGAISALSATAEARAVEFTLAAPANASVTKVMADETELEKPYKVVPGTTVTVTYTANEGYLFSNGTNKMDAQIKIDEAKQYDAPEGTETTEGKAKIGDVYYLTLQAAITAAGEEEFAGVVLVADTAEKDVTVAAGQSIMLYLNNHTLTANGQGIDNYGSLEIFGGQDTEDENGTGAIVAREGAVNVFKDSVTHIYSGTFTSTDNAVVMGNGNKEHAIGQLMINGGTFNSSIKTPGYIACGVYIPNVSYGGCSISGATFNITNGCGICARAGTTYIESTVVFNLVNPGEAGWVGDKKSTVPCVDVYFDWTIPPYPGYTEGDTIYSQDNTFTTSSDQEWSAEPDEWGYYTLQKKATTYTFTLTPEIAGTEVKVYTNDTVEVTAGEGGYTVLKGAEVKIVYTAATGKLFADGTDTKTLTKTISADGAIDVSGEVDTPTDAEAKIGTQYYLTLQEAVDAATAESNKVEMLADVTIDYYDALKITKQPITLDLGGNTLTSMDGYNAIESSKDLVLTNGTVVAINGGGICMEGGNLAICTAHIQVSGQGVGRVMYAVTPYANFTLSADSSIKVKGDYAYGIHDDYTGGDGAIVINGKVEVEGEDTTAISIASDATKTLSFGETAVVKSTEYILYYEVGSESTISIEHGTFDGVFDTVYVSDPFISGGSFNLDPDDGYYGDYIVEGCQAVQRGDRYVVGVPAAKIGDVYYLTLQEALDAAEAGNTVEMLADMTLDATLTLDKAITLDLGEKEITLPTAGDGIKVTANATVKNGTLTSQLAANTAVYALHSYKTSATYEDLVINGANYRFVVYAEGADTIAACYGENDPTTTVTCNNVDVTGNGTLFEAEFTKMNLDANCSGIAEGTPWNYAAAIYSAGNATVTIAGGAYTNTLALLSGNLGGSIIVNGGAFGGDIKSWMESDKHTAYHSDPKFKANFMFNAGTYNGAIVFEDSSDAARELDSFSKLIKVAIDAPEGYEWKNFAATQYYHLSKKSDTPSIPENQGAIAPVEGKENTYAVSNTTETVDISNLPANSTIILDPSVTYLSGMAENTTVKIVAESTNTTEKVVDITTAFKVLSGTGTTATIALDKDASVTIDGDTIPVTPEVTTASEGTIAEGAVATKAIPGLTYTLVRDSDVGGTFETTADSETAKGTAVTLKDETGTKPTDKAFYKIQVTK